MSVISAIPQALAPMAKAEYGATAAAAGPKAPFSDLLHDSVESASRLEEQARAAADGLMNGTGVDVHHAMIAAEKAQMGFELVLAVRNKAVAAYQQVMNMQF